MTISTKSGKRWLAFIPLLVATLLWVGISDAAAQQPRAFDCATITDIPQAECVALVDIYNSMDGANWLDSTGWLTENDTSACDWYGVSCSATNVTYLYLTFNGLNGAIPTSIDDLTELQFLYLDGIVGAAPTELANLTDLMVLSLEGPYSNPQFTGPLPDLSALSNLTTLNISYSTIGGAFPSWISEANLPNLTSLTLRRNGFTGSVPSSLTSMTGLEEIRIEGISNGGMLSGAFPDFSATCATLTSLDLSNNYFTTGPLPSWITNSCDNLTALNLNYTGLTGPFPNLNSLINLTDISLGHNQFDLGPVPSWLINMSAPRFIGIPNTFRTGTIPEFANPSTIESLQLDNNRFTGGIPASYNVSTYPNLYNVNFFGNNLTSIHPNFATFTASANNTYTSVFLNALIPSSLDTGVQAYLDSVNNGWRTFQMVPPTTFSITPLAGGTTATVTITPIPVDYLSNINYIVEASTTAGGPYTQVGFNSVAADSSTPFNLTASGLTPETTYHFVIKTRSGAGYGTPPVLNFYFRDSVYSAEQSSTTLAASGPTNCADTGTNGIPQAECDALVTFYNNNGGTSWTNDTNWLTGSPCTWNGITCASGHVTQVVLQNNGITGTIPNLSALSELVVFDLRNNALTGTFPSWIANHDTLGLVGLSSNNLSGTIPDLSAMSSLSDLYLAVNNFSGGFPIGLANKTTVNRLWLDYNDFTGSIPDLSGMTGLLMLTIYNNDFSGTLPNLPDEQFVFLGASGNSFSGEIPASYGTLTDLTGLALDGNTLNGEIPASIGDLPNLGDGVVLSYVGFSYNALTATDSDVLALLAIEDTDFAATQTIAPTAPNTSSPSANSITLAWTPIRYTGNTGYYEVGYRVGTSGAYTFSATNRTADKTGSSLTVGSLAGGTNYCFVVRTVTLPHTADNGISLDNDNTLTSANSAEVCATTTGSGTPTNPPSATVLTAPSNALSFTGTKTPSLVWQENAPVEQVTTYKVTLKNQATGANVLNKTYTASSICVGEVCTLDLGALSPVVTLANGTYNWQITATNVVGSTKSAKFLFTLTKPSKAGLTAPIGNATINDPTPELTFTITEGENLTSIKVTVTKVNATSPVFTTTITDIGTACTGVNCIVTMPSVANGSYTWKIQTKNANGNNNSATGSFKIAFPVKASGLTPTGNATVNTQKPVLSWNEVPDAAEYRVTVQHVTSGTKVVLGWAADGATGLTCDAGVCTLDMSVFTGAPSLKKGAHEWSVEARNTALSPSKSKSAVAKFKVVLPTRSTGEEALPLPPTTFRAP